MGREKEGDRERVGGDLLAGRLEDSVRRFLFQLSQAHFDGTMRDGIHSSNPAS